MRVCALAASLWLVASSVHAQELSPRQITPSTNLALRILPFAQTADLVTTEIGLRAGTLAEQDPVMRGPTMHRVAMGVASYLVIRHYAQRLDRSGHRQWAQWGTWAAVGIECAAASWNASLQHRVMQRMQTP
jgi:hypothetical protein